MTFRVTQRDCVVTCSITRVLPGRATGRRQSLVRGVQRCTCKALAVMATNFTPDLSVHPLSYYVNVNQLRVMAEKAENLIAQFPQLKVWNVHYKPQKYADTSWNFGFCTQPDPYVLNVRLASSNFRIEFRYSQYLPQDTVDHLRWQNASQLYADWKSQGDEGLACLVNMYLGAIREDYDCGRLRQGGRSFAEKMIRRHLEQIYPQMEIVANRRPDELRSSLNKPLELDLYMPGLQVAIEIQGPQHFIELYGDNTRLLENDKYKKKWCRSHGIKLMWMNWDGISRLLFLPSNVQIDHLRSLLERLLKGTHAFLWWKSPKDQHWE